MSFIYIPNVCTILPIRESLWDRLKHRSEQNTTYFELHYFANVNGLLFIYLQNVFDKIKTNHPCLMLKTEHHFLVSCLVNNIIGYAMPRKMYQGYFVHYVTLIGNILEQI